MLYPHPEISGAPFCAGLPQAAAGQPASISGLASSLPGRRDDGFWEDLVEKKAEFF